METEREAAMDTAAAFVAALSGPKCDIGSRLEPSLSDEVTFAGLGASAEGRKGVVEALENPLLAAILNDATWSSPDVAGGYVSIRAVSTPGRRLAGVVANLILDDAARITRIALEAVSAPAPAPRPMVITQDMRAAVDGALANGTPIIVSYVDGGGVPHLSLRGSAHVHGERQLGLWNRDANGGMSRALTTNANVALFYRDPTRRITYTFTGRARVVSDPGLTEAVYRGAPEPEQNTDPMRRGVAVIVDLDRIEGAENGIRFVMSS